MAHRILKRFPRTISRGCKEIKQQFNYLLVMDFEATCLKGRKIEPQEIIEFPCIAVSTQNWNVDNVFHKYVKPRVHPQLTSFCTELTGIIQEMLDDEPHFPVVLDQFCTWLEECGYFKNDNKSAFVTCGDWDLSVMLPSQCALDGLTVPEHFKKWINLKTTFCDSTRYYPRSLTDMLMRLNLTLEGRLHSGISDTKNMVSIIQALQRDYNAEFKITSTEDGLKRLRNIHTS